MPSSERRTHVLPAPVPEVWAVLADFGGISRWATTLDHSTSLDARPGLGAARRIQVGRTTLIETVDGWEPPRRLSYRIEGLPPRLGTIANEWRLEPEGDATHATVTTTVDTGPRPPHKLVERLVLRRLARASVELLSGLSAHLAAPGARG